MLPFIDVSPCEAVPLRDETVHLVAKTHVEAVVIDAAGERGLIRTDPHPFGSSLGGFPTAGPHSLTNP